MSERFLYKWSFSTKIPEWVFLWYWLYFLLQVQVDRFLSLREIHVTIRFRMINFKGIIIIDYIILIFKGSRRNQFEYYRSRKLLGYLDFKCSFSWVCSLHHTIDIWFRLNMSEYYLGPIFNLFTCFGSKSII